MKLRHYIAAALLVPILLLLRFVAEVGEEAPGVYVVSQVIDGDTVELNGREKLRLAGIDTPERGQPFYDSAREFLSDLVLRRTVRLELGFRKRDTYGRLLGYMFINGTFVNAELLKQGLGRMYLFADNRYQPEHLDRLFAAQRQAMAAQIGIWTLPPVMEEEYYIGNNHSMRFHRPDCRSAARVSANRKVIFDSRESAFYDGFSPCRNCRP